MEGGEGEEEWYEEDEAYEEGHAEDAEEYCDEDPPPGRAVSVPGTDPHMRRSGGARTGASRPFPSPRNSGRRGALKL